MIHALSENRGMEKVAEQVFRKGDIVSTLQPWSIIVFHEPLPFPGDFINNLPRYEEIGPFYRAASFQGLLKSFVARMLRNATHCAFAVVAAMDVALEEKVQANGVSGDGDFAECELEEEEQEMISEGWTLLQNHITWRKWVDLYRVVKACLVVVSTPHPLAQYCNKILPLLPHDSLLQCRSILKEPLELKSCDPENAFLALCQDIENICKPVYVGFLIFDPFKEMARYPKHSCIPCTGPELIHATLNLVATFDFGVDEEVTMAYVDTSLPHADRCTDLKNRFGTSFQCPCVRCKSDVEDIKDFSFRDLTRIGHQAFQQNHFERALEFYNFALQVDMLQSGDILHAIGAIYLAQNKFLKAQRHWRNCVTESDLAAFHKHPGIQLQLTKLQAFRYFDQRQEANAPKVKYTSMFGGQCFVTEGPVATSQACADLIAWVESAQDWTTSRHYAVPTNDIPVHQVPRLLTWFNQWMEETIYPLLGLQFDLNPNDFFVHDAFVVRYQGQQSNNYLPIHVDESTHSFVLALNDEFSGGGTYFVDYNIAIVPKQPGTLVSFRGDSIRHGGNVVTKGMRYILAVFLYHDTSNKKRTLANVSSTLNDAKRQSSFAFRFDL